ncbi:MAG: HesA/MoeB/ThiF family protein [Vicingaceae bacterium]
MNRYLRQEALPYFGKEKQVLVGTAKVLIIGAGGLGCPAALYLAGAGVGKLIIADSDFVHISNLHRQTIFKESQLGSSKAEALCKHLRSLNSEISIESIESDIDYSNVREIIASVDIVLDCTDNLPSRYLINDACTILEKPFVSASIFRHEGQIGTFNYHGSGTYRCLFPSIDSHVPSCEDVGVLGPLTGILGSFQANEAIKIITGIGDVIKDKILLINILNNTTSSIAYLKNETAIHAVLEDGLKSHRPTNELGACEIDLDELTNIDKGHLFYFDVREENEKMQRSFSNAFFMPLSRIDPGKIQVPKEAGIVCFCHSGIRSQQAAKLLRWYGWKHVRSFTGSMDDLARNNLILEN